MNNEEERSEYENAWKQFSDEERRLEKEEQENNSVDGEEDEYYYYDDEEYEYEYPDEIELTPEDSIPPELLHVEVFQHKITTTPETTTTAEKKYEDPEENEVYPKDSPYRSSGAARSAAICENALAIVLPTFVVMILLQGRTR